MFSISALLPFAIVTLAILALLRQPLSRNKTFDLQEQAYSFHHQTAPQSINSEVDNWFIRLIATLAATMIAWHFVAGYG
jgi:hypothetical protein